MSSKLNSGVRYAYMRSGAAWERLWVKADTVLFAGNTVWSISQRVRGVREDALYKSTLPLPLRRSLGYKLRALTLPLSPIVHGNIIIEFRNVCGCVLNYFLAELIYCEFFIFQQMAARQWARTPSVSVSHFNVLKWETPMFNFFTLLPPKPRTEYSEVQNLHRNVAARLSHKSL